MTADLSQEINNIYRALNSIQISQNLMNSKPKLDMLSQILRESYSATVSISKELEILQSLHYKSIMARHSKIVAAYKKTFEWIFDAENLPPCDFRSKIGFSKWLRCQNGIFWVSGKAGLGKSTLMKYISDDLRMMTSLYDWAGISNIFTASFYFWNAGTDMQKSQQGFLQSMLFEILSNVPN
ncbi:hypothetical protein F5884DRAFT_28946 [Xylogone sp. PMI_703]|nr:hypothetical protein F5884DRAFT_28946 [Xylogone sp. PMI_703]